VAGEDVVANGKRDRPGFNTVGLERRAGLLPSFTVKSRDEERAPTEPHLILMQFRLIKTLRKTSDSGHQRLREKGADSSTISGGRRLGCAEKHMEERGG